MPASTPYWSPGATSGVSSVTSLPRSDPRWVALGAILLLAAVLRLVGARYGLPYPLLNPDEASIVPRAWRMAHEASLDPGWYDYPSLLFALVAPLQALAGEPSYGLARVIGLGAGLGGVAAAWWLGRRAYGTGAAVIGALVVAVATTHVAYSRMAVTDVLLTTLLTCALALAVSGRVEWAGLVVGLAASAKYPGAIGLVAVLVAGWGAWRRLGAAAVLALAGFAVTSPFLVVHAGAAWEDVSRVQRLARQGWLGFEDDPATPLAFLDRAWQGLGPALVVAAAGVLLALRRRTRADAVLVVFLVAYGGWLLTIEAHFDRYLLPLVPVLGVLAARARALVPVALLAVVVPLVWSAQDAVHLTRTDTRVPATEWVARELPPDAVLAVDPSALGRVDDRAVRLELPGPGVGFDERRSVERLRALGVGFVAVSGHVVDRVRAAPRLYPRELAFYDDLERSAVRVYRSDETAPGLNGPWVAVYRL